MRRYLTPCLLLVWCAVHAQTPEPQLFEISATKNLMGTQIDIAALHSEPVPCKIAVYHAFKEIERLEQLLSSHLPGSEVSRINNQAGQAPVKVSHETLSLIKRSVGYSRRFDGLFDITIGPISELWGFNSDHAAVPPPDSVHLVLTLVDYRKILINETDTTVALARRGMRLDLGGIGKGYAVDRAAAVLQQEGITHFMVNAGGDIYCSDHKLMDKKWSIGIKHPRRPEALLARLEAGGLAVTTSGDYERFLDIGNKRYHHIFDPRTGYPADLCQSVTVLSRTAEEGVVLAKYFFIIGRQKRRALPGFSEIASLFVDARGRVEFDQVLTSRYHLELLH